jgi:hypothetical protein
MTAERELRAFSVSRGSVGTGIWDGSLNEIAFTAQRAS